ncbi:unnamed protein product [Caenorhabditis auriculariae]|uniref:Uncharacterized protein n=1 Tax=Caenorhabditis auriculariae TaxID=2777116 RepID=A0A8S1H0V9_9PELO|nr:unnamed protein product [Caenorhabditis auriculariae]
MSSFRLKTKNTASPIRSSMALTVLVRTRQDSTVPASQQKNQRDHLLLPSNNAVPYSNETMPNYQTLLRAVHEMAKNDVVRRELKLQNFDLFGPLFENRFVKNPERQ